MEQIMWEEIDATCGPIKLEPLGSIIASHKPSHPDWQGWHATLDEMGVFYGRQNSKLTPGQERSVLVGSAVLAVLFAAGVIGTLWGMVALFVV